MQAYFRAIGCFVFTLLGALLFRGFFNINSYVFLVAGACFVALVWGGGCWVIGLTAQEKQMAIKIVKERMLKGNNL